MVELTCRRAVRVNSKKFKSHPAFKFEITDDKLVHIIKNAFDKEVLDELYLSADDENWLEGLRDGGVEGAQQLIDFIADFDGIYLSE